MSSREGNDARTLDSPQEALGHMTGSAPNRSARILGQDYGLTAVEMNFLLKEEGFLDGEPGTYFLTEKGKNYAHEQIDGRGTGGYLQYNPSWSVRTWNPSITDELDVTEERKQQLREAARAARQERAESRAIQGADLDNGNADDGDPDDSNLDPLTVAVGLVLTAISIYGIMKVAPHLKTLWTDKAMPRLKKLKNRNADDTEIDAETPESGEDPAT